MVQKKEWNEFRGTGLLLIINQILHIFGWAIVFEFNNDTGELIEVYPARVKFRGFDEKSTDEAYLKVTDYLKNNISELHAETQDAPAKVKFYPIDPIIRLYKHKHIGVEVGAFCFQDFVKFAKETTPEPHWCIHVGKHQISHENDECYIVPTPHNKESPNSHFKKGDYLVVDKFGDLFLVDINTFDEEFDLKD